MWRLAGAGVSTLDWDDIVLSEDAWVEHPAPSTVSDAVVRSQSGRIVQNTLTDDGVVEVSTYGFGDAVCGVTGAGGNGNRTSFTDTFDGGTPVTTTYCYDTADRLTGTSGGLTTTGPGATLGYDPHGNTTTFGDQTLTYDVLD